MKPPTIAQLAEAFDVSTTTVNNYVKRGMPRDSIVAAAAWREANVKKTPGPLSLASEDPDNLSLQFKLAELADKRESARARKLKNDVAEGQQISRLEVERDISIAVGRLTNKLNSLGTRCANLCPSELKPAIKEAVEDTVRTALKEIIDDLQERGTENDFVHD